MEATTFDNAATEPSTQSQESTTQPSETTTEPIDTTTQSQETTTQATTEVNQQETTMQPAVTTTENSREDTTQTFETTTSPAEVTTESIHEETTTENIREDTTTQPSEITTQSVETTESNREETTTQNTTTESNTDEPTTISTGGDTTTNIITTSSQPNGNNSCPPIEEGQAHFVCPTGFRRHPKDCGMFYQCTESPETSHLSIVSFKCPNGTIYDEEAIQCRDRTSSDNCPSSSQNTTLLRGTLFDIDSTDSPAVSIFSQTFLTYKNIFYFPDSSEDETFVVF
jgi:hypothetical protein